MAVIAKQINISNEVLIQGRPLTLATNVTDGKWDLVRLSFNGKGEVFSFPKEALPHFMELLRGTYLDVQKVEDTLAKEDDQL